MDAEGYADMLPWLVFVVIERKTGLGLGWAGGCAATSAVALYGWAYWHGRRAPVMRLALVVFAMLCLADFLVPAWSSQFADARAVATVALGVSALVSLRFTPLSSAYTAAQVAPSVHDDERFHRVNVEITTAWGVGALLVAVAFASSDFDHSAVAGTFLNWLIPLGIAAVVVLWVGQRWERARLEIEGDVPAARSAGRPAVPVDLGAWVEGHDAVVHPMPARGPRNA